MKILSKIALSVSTLLVGSCSLLEIDPDHVVSTDKAFSDVASYQMALTNVYRNLASSTMTMQASDYAGDDFMNVVPGYASTNYSIYYWDYVSQPQSTIWDYQYSLIANCNVVTDSYDLVPTNSTEESRLKEQIYAQALAMRAWSLFNIVQLYAPRYDGTNGDELSIPLKLKLELDFLPRSPLSEVYAQILSDLEEAETKLIDSSYAPVSSQRPYEFGLNAIRALRARIALFMGDLETAKENSAYFIATDLFAAAEYDNLWSDSWSDANSEVIFFSHDLSDTTDGEFIDYYEVFNGNNAVLSSELKALFETGDVRNSVDYITSNGIPSKYLIEASESSNASRMLHYKHFRVAEQYLIYAESVVDSDSDKALEVINSLRESRGAEPFTSAPTKEQIIEERRRELFSEGLRFYDLKRLAKDMNITVQRTNGTVLSPSSDLYVWDIPISETNSNPNI